MDHDADHGARATHDLHATDDVHAADHAHAHDGIASPAEPIVSDPPAGSARSAVADHVSQTRSPGATRPMWSRGELAGIAAAAVGGAAIVLTILVPRTGHREWPDAGSGAPPVAAVASAESARPAAATDAAAVDAPAGWQPASEWVGRRRNSVAFEVQANRAVRAWMRQVRPVLVMRCLNGSLDAFMVTGSATSIEPGRSDHTVRLAFDDDAPAVEHWADSAEHDGLFAPDGAAFLGRLSRARSLRVTFTPHNAPEAEASFSVAGADALVDPLRKHCR